jgi:hypothetical protein
MSEAAQVPELCEDERRTLDGVLDEIIPPSADGRLPGAGELGLARYVAWEPALIRMVAQGLAALDAIARRGAGQHFVALPRGERVLALDELAASEQAFPPVLVLHAYAAYYQHPRVLEALGLEPRPPHPAGYATVAGDLSLLEPVRRRGRTYRDC